MAQQTLINIKPTEENLQKSQIKILISQINAQNLFSSTYMGQLE